MAVIDFGIVDAFSGAPTRIVDLLAGFCTERGGDARHPARLARRRYVDEAQLGADVRRARLEFDDVPLKVSGSDLLLRQVRSDHTRAFDRDARGPSP